MKKSLLLVVFLSVTAAFGTIYVVAQQIYRQSANDPQIQLAEDAASMSDPTAGAGSLKLDPSKSLAPFLIFYDEQGRETLSQAEVGGKSPSLPQGVLRNTTESHQSRLTWEPSPNVRIAAVVVKSKQGYVLAGRLLKEVEKREEELFGLVSMAWLATLIIGGLLLGWSKRARN